MKKYDERGERKKGGGEGEKMSKMMRKRWEEKKNREKGTEKKMVCS